MANLSAGNTPLSCPGRRSRQSAGRPLYAHPGDQSSPAGMAETGSADRLAGGPGPMKTHCLNSRPNRAYMLFEALVYIGVVVVVLGVAYLALDRSIRASVL